MASLLLHDSVQWPLLPIAAGLILAYAALHCVYQLFFSPLRIYPGSKFAAVCRLPYVYHCLRGNQVWWINNLHTRYGDVVRVSPDEISYANGDAWKAIYGHSTGGKKTTEKDLRFYGLSFNGAPDIIRARGPDHARFRRNFSHAFSDRALREQQPLIQHYVDMLIAKLTDSISTSPDAAIELVRMFNLTTFDIMGDLTFGDPLDLLRGTGSVNWVTSLYSGIKVNALRRVSRYYPLSVNLFNACLPATMKAKAKAHHANCMDRVDKRVAAENMSRPDIWGLVMSQKEELRLSRGEMHANSQVFMVAGTETTATALSGLTYQLLLNPEKMERITREVREAFASDAEIEMGALVRLEYLNACIEEGLRVYPPVPVGLPRVVPAGGLMVCGQYVPENTSVSVSQWSTYRNPKNFTRADEFLPERWMDDPEFAADDKGAFQPFSFGPRNCLGKNLAYHEMRIILAKVLYHFDLSLVAESKGWERQKTFLLWEKNGLLVKLQRRTEV